MKMAENVFILGAGASRKAGAPLMKEFLDSAEDLLKKGKIGDAKGDFELVFRAFESLKMAAAKAQMDFENVESVFAAFEMAKLLGRLDDLGEEDLNRLPSAMRRVIFTTLEERIKLPVSHQHPRAPSPYEEFVELVRKIGAESTVSIITFNYDLCLDLALLQKRIEIDYCLDPTDRSGGIKYIKLHGSLNWGRCSSCNKIVPWLLQDFFGNFHWNIYGDDTKEVSFHLASLFKEFKHCDKKGVVLEPIIVPPTWNKGQHHEELREVWKAGAAELSNAENIFIIGYSLPETDQFFRNLFALGTIGRARIRQIKVFDPNAAVHEKFRTLFGPLAAERYFPEVADFDNAIAIIQGAPRRIAR